VVRVYHKEAETAKLRRRFAEEGQREYRFRVGYCIDHAIIAYPPAGLGTISALKGAAMSGSPRSQPLSNLREGRG